MAQTIKAMQAVNASAQPAPFGINYQGEAGRIGQASKLHVATYTVQAESESLGCLSLQSKQTIFTDVIHTTTIISLSTQISKSHVPHMHLS